MKKLICAALAAVFILNVIFAQAVNVSAACAVLINAETGEIVFGLAENTRASMASTTKIMTSILLCEKATLSDTLLITPEMVKVEGTSMGLKAGMTVTYKDLLYGMLLSSGNDAANAAAIGISGSINAFVELMNQKAKQLGLNNTNFNTPSGLDGDTHYTTALELALLTRYALNNADFAKACATKSITLNYGGVSRTLTNHNRLLNSYSGCIGVKTGYTSKSGRCLVSAASKNGVTLIAVTLNDKNDWQDHKAMLDYGFSVVKTKTVAFKKETFSVLVAGGKEKFVTATSDEVELKCSDSAEIKRKVYITKFLYAPVNKGDCVGYILYTKNGLTVAAQRLLAEKGVEKNPPPTFFQKFIRNFEIVIGEII